MANMAPAGVPRWSQNEEKIDAEIDQKIDASWDRFFERVWEVFGSQNGAMLAPKWYQKSMLTSKGWFAKKWVLPWEKLLFLRANGWKSGTKIDQNRSKKEFNMGRSLGICTILVDLGRQVGVENRTKIDPKRHRKSDEKKKFTNMAKGAVRRSNASRRRVSRAPREGGKGIGAVSHSKPPSHKGLVGL